MDRIFTDVGGTKWGDGRVTPGSFGIKKILNFCYAKEMQRVSGAQWWLSV
jgi:hypothetical protein